MRKSKMIIAFIMIALGFAVSFTGCTNEKRDSYEPLLDTDKRVVLDIKGFFGNFEALDQVMADFNEYYPNVTYSYEQVGADGMKEYLATDANIDIFMTSDEVLWSTSDRLDEYYADLSKEDVSFKDIDEQLLDASKVDGQIVTIPMGQVLYGMIVNETLLEKEGLSVPETYDEFMDTLSKLKSKGYTPIQGPTSKMYAESTMNMVMDLIESDDTLYTNLKNGDEGAVDTLLPVVEKIDALKDNGYTDEAVNAEYPEDNYDEAILKFFEGDVPFWVCDTEKVSGMKKRESKSETFAGQPFEYSYVYVPMGKQGVYEYHAPWYGFSVSKKAANYEYAVEFIRFLTQKEEMNVLADTKGIPSMAVDKTDNALYEKVNNPSKVEMNCYKDEKIKYEMTDGWYKCVNGYISGEYADRKEMLKEYVKICGKAFNE